MSIYLNKIRRKVGFSYEKNVSLRLVLTLAGFYIGLQALYIIIMVLSKNQAQALTQLFLPEIAIQDLSTLTTKPWTLFTYMLFHVGFWEFATNMAWLYLFSSVIQSLIGYKEIVMMFISNTILGGLLYLILNSFLHLNGNIFIVGSFAGIMGIALASIILAPKHKIYISEHLTFPLGLAFVIYLALNILSFSATNPNLLLLIASGGLIGAIYMMLIKNGIKIGGAVHDFINKFFAKMGGNSSINKEDIAASKMVLNKNDEEIDFILEKIHKQGILSLTDKEKSKLEDFSNKI